MKAVRFLLAVLVLSLLGGTLAAQQSNKTTPTNLSGAGFWTKTNIDVPPSPRQDPDALYPSGELAPAGFTRMVLSLSGEARRSQNGGKVGVLLVPDEDGILRAMKEDGSYPFAIEISFDAPAGEKYLAAKQVEVPVGFRSYRVYFFNETGDRVLVDLYAYLTR